LLAEIAITSSYSVFKDLWDQPREPTPSAVPHRYPLHSLTR